MNQLLLSISVVLLVFIFVVFILLEILREIINYLNSPVGQAFIATFTKILIVASTIGISLFCVWKYHRRRVQKQRKSENAEQDEEEFLERAQKLRECFDQEQEKKYLREDKQERMYLKRAQKLRECFDQEQEKALLEEEEFLERAQKLRECFDQEQEEQEHLQRMESLGDLLALTPRAFEELTGKILMDNGLQEVRRVGGSGDLGADLVARNRNGQQVIVQCKRYAPGNAIGSPVMQTFIGMIYMHHKAEQGIFVTTSTFTLPATKLAEEHNIQLIGGDQLVLLMQKMQRLTFRRLEDEGEPHSLEMSLSKELFITSRGSTGDGFSE